MSGRRALEANAGVPTGGQLMPELVNELLETASNVAEDLSQIKYSLIGESEGSDDGEVIPPQSVYDKLAHMKTILYSIQQDATRLRTFTCPVQASLAKTKAVR